MATRAQILRLEQRIEGLAQAAGAGAMVDLFGWGDETVDEVIARALPHRPELAHTPRQLMRFTFFRWRGRDGRHLTTWQREGSNGHKSSD